MGKNQKLTTEARRHWGTQRSGATIKTFAAEYAEHAEKPKPYHWWHSWDWSTQISQIQNAKKICAKKEEIQG